MTNNVANSAQKIAVILSGCGHQDGAEIRESVLALLELSRAGADVSIFAPDAPQPQILNHITGEAMPEQRNMMVEAARIARGNIKALSTLQAESFDALVIPGGFGVAKNLSNFAEKGLDSTVMPDFERVVNAFAKAGKPIGAICIAPAVVARVLGKEYAPTVTIGDCAGTASAIEACGAKHQNCPTEDIVVDAKNRIVSCSAYMRDDELHKVAQGIEKLVRKVLALASEATARKAA